MVTLTVACLLATAPSQGFQISAGFNITRREVPRPIKVDPSVPTRPAPAGEGWEWNAQEQHWERWVPAPVSTQSMYAAPRALQAPVFYPQPVFAPAYYQPAFTVPYCPSRG